MDELARAGMAIRKCNRLDEITGATTMNKHLKPGVAVDVRGASDEVKEQVMAA